MACQAQGRTLSVMPMGSILSRYPSPPPGTTRERKQHRAQERKQQLAQETKQIIARLEDEGWTLDFTDGSAKQHPKIGWVAGYGCVVMGHWETKGFLPAMAQANNGAELQAVITVLSHFHSSCINLVVVMDS